MSDNFTQLWASFREQVQEARTPRERPSIYTAGESAMTQRDGGRVSIWEPAMSETPHTTTVGINTRTAGLRFQVQAEDCVAIAAQLMAVAEEMQGIQLPANFDTQNHSHLITQRVPVEVAPVNVAPQAMRLGKPQMILLMAEAKAGKQTIEDVIKAYPNLDPEQLDELRGLVKPITLNTEAA
jgi:hypothetical protein